MCAEKAIRAPGVLDIKARIKNAEHDMKAEQEWQFGTGNEGKGR